MGTLQITAAELFAIAKTSALAGQNDSRLDLAYLNILEALNDGESLDHNLVKTKIRLLGKQLKLRDRDRARNGPFGSSPVALQTSVSKRSDSSPGGHPCTDFKCCPMHCVDPKTGKWRPAPKGSAKTFKLVTRRPGYGTGDELPSDEDFSDTEYTDDDKTDVLRRADEAGREARLLYLSRHLDE